MEKSCTFESLSTCNVEEIFSIIASVATVVGIIGVLVGAWAAYRQLKASKQIARGQFMLTLKEMSSKYDDIHRKLRPGGQWAGGVGGPKNASEWAMVDDYMGFFEHCELLIRNGSLDEIEFKTIYGYRLQNIVTNEHIVKEKLRSDEQEYWKVFIGLLERLKRLERFHPDPIRVSLREISGLGGG